MFSIYDGRKQFYQWDTSRKLIINDKTISEVHFANCLCAEARKCIPYAIGDLLVVDVPNQLLTEYQDIRVWGYDSGMTKHDAVFEVEKRTKPADYIYTPEELKTWEELKATVEEMNNIVNALPQAFEMLYEQISALEDRVTALETGKKIIYFHVNGEQCHAIEGTTWEEFLRDGDHPFINSVCENCGTDGLTPPGVQAREGDASFSTYCRKCYRANIYKIVDQVECEYVKLDDVIIAENRAYDTMLVQSTSGEV